MKVKTLEDIIEPLPKKKQFLYDNFGVVRVSCKKKKMHFPSFRRKPESSNFRQMLQAWTPASAGVTNYARSSFVWVFLGVLFKDAKKTHLTLTWL